jgi:hypothetical protein
MDGAEAVLADCLERVAARCADPAPLVFARLFAENPALEPLFVRDRAGLVRGQMLQVALETLLDLAGPGHYAVGMLQCERTNHDGLGVPARQFDCFFVTVMATFRDILGIEWTDEMETTWLGLISNAQTLLAD